MPTMPVITLQFLSQRLKLRSLSQRWTLDESLKTRKRETMGTLVDRVVFAEARYVRTKLFVNHRSFNDGVSLDLHHYPTTYVGSGSC